LAGWRTATERALASPEIGCTSAAGTKNAIAIPSAAR